ncbi:unnamed protein product [Lactuca saligna]|uniref:Uncharacterized protein n=1 Tax=Lactuca saligna TaxID=75948 RepID=A0AA35Y9N6_LACSI|nr:unnamed protein product [Lactuca saligna]
MLTSHLPWESAYLGSHCSNVKRFDIAQRFLYDDNNNGRGIGDKSDDNHNNADKHGLFVDEDGYEVGFEYKVHDLDVKWSKIELHVGEIYEPLSQLRFALTNYIVANGCQLWFVKFNIVCVISKCGRKEDKKPCPFKVYGAWM